jgi:homopolymeric O-antigen transport system ATP-binding protein
MNDIAIHVEGLSKSYKIGRKQARYSTIRDSIKSMIATSFRRLTSSLSGHSAIDSEEEIWALKDVSFDIERGEIVGVIGRNGAGKSTLLKILTGITEPTKGCATIRGRVASLLEVGTGFHPELTGRENIFLNGSILGMKRSEIDSKFDEIVAFSEIEKFIDTPVKHYSSGMYMRLAFSVAAYLEAEILLVDEVLAVGDINFQQKCINKMSEVSKLGQTVLVVSHNLRVVETLTNRCIYLKEGVISNIGETKQIVNEYQKDALSMLSSLELPSEYDIKINNPTVKIIDFILFDRVKNEIVNNIKPETPISFNCTLESSIDIDTAVVCLIFYKDRLALSGNNSHINIGDLVFKENGKYKLDITIDGLWLVPGNYSVVLYVIPNYFSQVSSSLSEFCIINFVVLGSRSYGGGYISIKQDWNIENIN